MAEQLEEKSANHLKMEMLHQIVTNMNRFMENQTRVINKLVSQVNELQARLASCERSQESNSRAELDRLAKEDTPIALPRASVNLPTCVEGKKSLLPLNDSCKPSVGDSAPPITPRRILTVSTEMQQDPARSMQRPMNLFEDRRAPPRSDRPVPLPRSAKTPTQPEVHSMPRLVPSAIAQPYQRQTCTTPPIPAVRIKLSPKKFSGKQASREGKRTCRQQVRVVAAEVEPPPTPYSLRTTRSAPLSRSPQTSRSPLSTSNSPLPRSPISMGYLRRNISPRQERRSDSRMQRITERGVRGHIRCFIAGRNFGFATREDNGENIFLHRNEVVNLPEDAAINFQEGDYLEFDVMRTERTPSARNVKLIVTGLETQQRSS